MEGLTRLVSESLARHGFDRPLDYRRLHWSRWFRCESHHSLLFVPSTPGVFAVAEEIMDLDSTPAHAGTSHAGTSQAGTSQAGTSHVGTDAFVRPATLSEAKGSASHVATAASAVPRCEASGAHIAAAPRTLSEAKGSGPVWDRVSDPVKPSEARQDFATRNPQSRRMLAVTQFFEDDDMAFVLDRMLSTQNPMRARLISGRYFVRFVVIEDQSQRRTICNALNQWMVTAAEKATGIGSHFATSLELTSATEYVPEVRQDLTHKDLTHKDLTHKDVTQPDVARAPSPASPAAVPHQVSNLTTNINPFPSGF